LASAPNQARHLIIALAPLALVTAGGCGGDIFPLESTDVAQSALFGGVEVSRCQWTNVVALGNRCTGVALHPEVVVYAAHCGEQFSSVRAGDREYRVRECRSLPGHALGGTDVAYCRLAERITEDLVPPALGCELDSVAPGTAVTMAGYGRTHEEGQFGTRRISQGIVDSLDASEIVVGGPGTGICPGDSGGPLFVTVVDRDGQPSQRVLGIASASPTGPCRESPSHYARLAPHLQWLEAETGFDLTPCGRPDGTWEPTPGCTISRPSSGAQCEERISAGPSAACGQPFAFDRVDDLPPTIAIRAPGPQDEHVLGDLGTAEVTISIDARDAGWGLKEVRAVIFDSSSRAVWSDARSLPPYDFPAASLSLPGRYTLAVAAIDHADRLADAEQIVEVRAARPPGDGCRLAPDLPTRRSRAGDLAAAIGCVVSLWLRRRRYMTGVGKPRPGLANR